MRGPAAVSCGDVSRSSSLAGCSGILGRSAWAGGVRRKIARVAPSTSTVLIVGPTGTGKELIARCIHEQSPRRRGPFVPVDCASITGTLCSSQLFGHVKGAFTGADYESLGCFRAAEGGTIFLDEIGELEPSIQAMLLRTLQERIVVPVGNHREIPVDVRVIAATNRVLDEEVQAARFRMDLLYRLRVMTIQTTSLRQRLEDVSVLAEHFLTRLSKDNGIPAKELSVESLAVLLAHDWPGNVRELQNVLECAAIFSDSESIQPSALRIHKSPAAQPEATAGTIPAALQPFSPHQARGPEPAECLETWLTLPEVEAQHIARTLEVAGYNQSAAARMLAIDRHVLARKMKKYGLRKPEGLQ
ncbi:sigma-54 interaction domain-containing protein [Roseimaritima ulvae]|nr:sigma-54 dependent transcriptional regulator [Roseimaritima ulvae]